MPISVSIYNVHHHIRAAGVLLAALFSFVQEGFVRLRDTTSLAEGKARQGVFPVQTATEQKHFN
jgi:hypothetical protein